jgi:23S rRNA (guanosine2251-2'-O)-methyltransferase
MKKEDHNLLYGLKPVIESLKGGRGRVKKIFLQYDRTGKEVNELMRLARDQGISVKRETRESLNHWAGTPKHQGVVASVQGLGPLTFENLLDNLSAKKEPAFLAVLDGIEDPRNLGAILRTADAVGLHGVILPQRRAVGLTATVGKTSAGAIEHIPVAQVTNIVKSLEQLRKEGIWLVGLEADSKKSYLEFDYTMPVALVVGAEGKGIRPLALSTCDETVSIPMRGSISSLNMSVAFAVLAYEEIRQRTL